MSYSKQAERKGIKLYVKWWQPKGRNNGAWRKTLRINGKQQSKTFNYPDTFDGYADAVADAKGWVREQQDSRPNIAVWKHHRETFGKVSEYFQQFGATDDEAGLPELVEEFLAWIDDQLTKQELPETIPFPELLLASKGRFVQFLAMFDYLDMTVGYRLPDMWEDRLRRMEAKPKPTRKPQTVGFWIEDFLSWKEREGAKLRTVKSCRQRLKRFRLFVGDNSHVKDVLTRWRDYEGELLDASLSNATRTSERNAVLEFAGHCADDDGCILETIPKRRAKFRNQSKNEPRKDWVWTKEEYWQAYNQLNDHYRCWLLLMLNCAYTQTDLNEIRHSQYDGKRIIRARTKTERTARSPVVNYKLWPMTIEAIEKVKSDDPDWLLLTERGARLTEPFDNVARTYGRLRHEYEHFDLPDKELKGIRKTVATTLKNSRHIAIRTLYLGNVGEIVDKHYDDQSGRIYKPLDRAVDYIGKQFGIIK